MSTCLNDICKTSDHARAHRPELRTATSEFTSMQKESSTNQQTIHMMPIAYHSPESTTITPAAPQPLQTQGLRTRGRSPLNARTDDITESPHAVSRVGSPFSTAPTQHTEAGDANREDVEFRRKLHATRMRRLTEHEFLRPGTPRRAVDV
jgi:hypothetical protein